MKILTITLAATLQTGLVFAQDQPPPRREPGDAQRPPPTERRESPRPDTDRPPGGLPPVAGGRVGGPEIEHRRPDVRPGKHVSRDYLIHAPDPIPPKPQAFLGVVTGPLEPTLSAQLGLSEGVGLVVQDVLPDSPAAQAGVQKHDVLKHLNDQLLTSPEQLATLVRHFGKDKDVTLALVRQGQEQKVTAKIGERLMPERRPLSRKLDGPPGGLPKLDEHLRDVHRNLEKVQRDLQKQQRTIEEKVRNFVHPPRDPHPPSPVPPIQPVPPVPPAFPGQPGKILRQIGPGGAGKVKVSKDQASTTWRTANARVVLKDEKGEIEVRSGDGKRTLIARDPRGEVVFKGPIATEAELQSVPPEFREMLKKVDVQSQHGEKGIVVSRAAANSSAEPIEPPPVEEPVASDADVQ